MRFPVWCDYIVEILVCDAYFEVVTEFLYMFKQFSCLKYKNYLLFA